MSGKIDHDLDESQNKPQKIVLKSTANFSRQVQQYFLSAF